MIGYCLYHSEIYMNYYGDAKLKWASIRYRYLNRNIFKIIEDNTLYSLIVLLFGTQKWSTLINPLFVKWVFGALKRFWLTGIHTYPRDTGLPCVLPNPRLRTRSPLWRSQLYHTTHKTAPPSIVITFVSLCFLTISACLLRYWLVHSSIPNDRMNPECLRNIISAVKVSDVSECKNILPVMILYTCIQNNGQNCWFFQLVWQRYWFCTLNVYFVFFKDNTKLVLLST